MLFTGASWVPLLLFGSGVITRLTPVSAQQSLPELRIFDELPPRAPSSIPSLDIPTSPLPSESPSPPPEEREFNFQAPNPPIPPSRPTSTSNLYRVDILGDSPLLLSQVRRLEPKAFVRQGEGVIQAGVFADRFKAQSFVRTLEAQGIQARVTTIDAGADADTVNRERLSTQFSYFVVIPGKTRNLSDITAQVLRLGVRRNAVSQREAPRGPHVAVGPFNSRGEADRWSSYFRSVGMDARVYFRR